MDQKKTTISDRNVDALVALLDGCTQAGDSRIKVDVVEGEGEMISRQYHHGRCDIASPWPVGQPLMCWSRPSPFAMNSL